MAEKSSRMLLSVAFKHKLLQTLEENLHKKKVDVVKEFDITPTTLAPIIKNKIEYPYMMNIYLRPLKYPTPRLPCTMLIIIKLCKILTFIKKGTYFTFFLF